MSTVNKITLQFEKFTLTYDRNLFTSLSIKDCTQSQHVNFIKHRKETEFLYLKMNTPQDTAEGVNLSFFTICHEMHKLV